MMDKLNRGAVTQGSLIILPAYPALFGGLGLFLLLQDPRRTSFAAYEPAKEIISIQSWGAIFLVIAILELFGLVLKNRAVFKAALTVGAGVSGFWAALLLSSALYDPGVSWTGGIWIVFVAIAHIASVRSLARDHVAAERMVGFRDVFPSSGPER